MDHESYDAACKGDIKHAQEITEQLNLIVTPLMKSTFLHVHIAFSNQVSTRFIEQVLEICPSLLLQVNNYGDTPLHVAVKRGHFASVEVLIEHTKSQHDDLEAEETLVKQMLRMTNNDGNTVLHEAAKNHNSSAADLVKLLISEDLYFPCDYANNCGEIPLHIAASEGSLDVVVEMLRTCTPTTYNYRGPKGLTILHVAVQRNDLDITRKILEKKCWTEEANKKEWSLTKKIDENGWTPLHFAAYYGYHLIVKLLVKFDASAACIADRHRKMTALHLAAGQGYYNIIYTIINSCLACSEQVDDRGWNYLHFAMCNITAPYGLQSFRWLYYPLSAKDVRGNTPLLVLASISQYSFDLMKKYIRREFIESTMHNIRNRGEQLDELKEEILELANGRCEPYNRGVVRLPSKDFLQQCSDIGKEAEKYLVVNALIATVTFTVGLTLPGGYIQEDSNKGTAVLIKNSAFKAFVISDAIALLLSVLAVWFQIFWHFLKLKRFLFVMSCAHSFTAIALAAMIIAFVTGTYAILRPSLGLAITTVMVGLSFFLIHTYVVYKGIVQRKGLHFKLISNPLDL